MESRRNAWQLYRSEKVFKLKIEWYKCIEVWRAAENPGIFATSTYAAKQEPIWDNVDVKEANKNVRYALINDNDIS